MMSSLTLRVLLLPVLVAQALAVRLRALKLPEAAGPRQGVEGFGPPLRLLIVGDSSAAGVGVDSQTQALTGRLVADLARDFTVHWRLEARTGATTGHMLRHLRRLDLGPVDVAVTALGVNDVTRQVPLRRWRRQQAALAALFLSLGARQIWRSGLPPMQDFRLLPRPLRDVLGARARIFDAALNHDSFGPMHRLPFDPQRLDPSGLAADGFHPGAPIYAAWAGDLAREIRQRA